MSELDATTARPRLLVWGLASLALAVFLGAVLTWGAGALARWNVLPPPQAPAWYDCQGAGPGFALHYLQGSDHMALRWPTGEALQADSWPDRIVWHNTAALAPARQAALPVAFRYESKQQLELRSAAGVPIVCTLRPDAGKPSGG
jgi:hypothetical protein